MAWGHHFETSLDKMVSSKKKKRKTKCRRSKPERNPGWQAGGCDCYIRREINKALWESRENVVVWGTYKLVWTQTGVLLHKCVEAWSQPSMYVPSVCAQVCGGLQSAFSVCSQELPTLFFWGVAISLGWLSILSQNPSVFASPALRLQIEPATLAFTRVPGIILRHLEWFLTF